MFLAVGPFGLGPMELVIILLVLVLLFGATRIADIGSGLGKGIREFRKNVKDEEEEEAAAAAPPATAAPPPAVHTESVAPTPVSASNGTETLSAVKCASCETLNVATAKFCTNCGAALAAPVT